MIVSFLVAFGMEMVPAAALTNTGAYLEPDPENGEETEEPQETGQNDELTENTEEYTDEEQSGDTGDLSMANAVDLLNTDPSTASDPVTEVPDFPDADYRKIYEYNSNVLFSGIFKKNTYSFRIENYWDTVYAYAQIQYTISPLIEDVPASLTFYVNDEPVDSFRLEYTDGGTKTAYVRIPVEKLKEGFNNFSISGYVRLYDEDGCLDDFSGANWVSVSQDSLIIVGYNVTDTANLLQYYPFPFVSSIDEQGDNCGIYVPEDADDAEMKAALLIRADLGDETSGSDDVKFGSLKEMSTDHRANNVIIASKTRLPENIRNSLPSDAKTNAGAYVFEYSGNGGTTLVITADNSDDLYEGAAMLMDDSRLVQEKGLSAFVASGAADTAIESSALSDLTVKETSIKDITSQNGLEFIGPFRQEQEIYLKSSNGFILGQGGKVTLNYRYSDNLDFDRSLLTVYWGSTPVASKKLTKEGAAGDSVSFTMPEDVVGTSATSVKIAFDLEIKDLYCTKREDQMPWAYVSGNSTLFLPVGNGTNYTLDLRPYPLERMGIYNALTVVVPDEMTSDVYDLLGRSIALYGSSIEPYGDLRVLHAFEASSVLTKENDVDSDRNLLVVGTPADNVFLTALNDSLSFQFNDAGDAFVSNNQLLLSDTYAKSIGVIQLIRSPYAENKAVLAVSAPNDTAAAAMVTWLRSEKNSWKLTGDAFVIDGTDESRGFTFLEAEKTAGMSLSERISNNKPAVILTMVSTIAMLILLLAVILLLTRYRHNKKRDEKR